MTVDHDTLVAYALGALTPEEEKSVVEHLRTHPDDAAYVRDQFESLAEFALSQTPATLHEGGEQALLERIRTQPSAVDRGFETSRQGASSDSEAMDDSAARLRPASGQARERVPRRHQVPGRTGPVQRRARWPLFLAVAAVIFVGLVTFLRPPDLDAQIAGRLRETCAEAGVVCEPLLGDEQQPLGTLARRADAGLLVVLDADPPEGQVFQAWQIVDGVATSLGVYQGRVLAVEAPLSAGSAFGITIEPPGGSPQPTSTPIAVVQI